MKPQSDKKNSVSEEAEKQGRNETAGREAEVEKTGGNRTEHESPIPDADQHRAKEHTARPQSEEKDSM